MYGFIVLFAQKYNEKYRLACNSEKKINKTLKI